MLNGYPQTYPQLLWITGESVLHGATEKETLIPWGGSRPNTPTSVSGPSTSLKALEH
jgi:hypothetical protein